MKWLMHANSVFEYKEVAFSVSGCQQERILLAATYTTYSRESQVRSSTSSDHDVDHGDVCQPLIRATTACRTGR